MRIYTVTRAGEPLAVVRASDRAEAIETTLALMGGGLAEDTLDIRDPSDAEMVGWLERRADYLLLETTGA